MWAYLTTSFDLPSRPDFSVAVVRPGTKAAEGLSKGDIAKRLKVIHFWLLIASVMIIHSLVNVFSWIRSCNILDVWLPQYWQYQATKRSWRYM